MRTGRLSSHPCLLGGSSDEGGYSPRRLDGDEMGNRSLSRRTAEGAILETRVILRMVVVRVIGRGAAGVRRTEIQQERGAARGHEPDGNIGAEYERSQENDGRHIRSLGARKSSLHGAHHAREQHVVLVGYAPGSSLPPGAEIKSGSCRSR